MPLPQSASKTAVSAFGHVDEAEVVDLDGSRFEHDDFAVAGEIISAFAVDLDGGESGRGLHDFADEAGEKRPDLAFAGAGVARCRDGAFLVVGGGLGAPADGEGVGFLAVDGERDGLGRFAERDRQDAGRERIERAGVTGLLGVEEALHAGERMRAGQAERLIEDQPAVDGQAFLAAGHDYFFSTSRRTFSE